MLKRIKETLTCNSSRGKSRTIHQSKIHLLHGGKNTYFYKDKVKSLLYSNKISTIPLVLSAFGLLLVLGMMISPSISTGKMMLGGNKAYAEEGVSNEPVPYTVPPDDGVSLTINTPLPDDEVIEKQVSGSGAKYITVDFTVGAHNVDDYKVYVQADSATLTGKSYSDTITTINAPTTATEMNLATKKWGYAVAEGQNVSADSMTFNTIQTDVSTPAASVAGENGAKILNHTQPYTLAFAANLDGAKADHYKSNITLSVAANAEEVTNIGFAGATYMQDVDKTFCDKDTIPIGTEGRLIDKRDGKVYWVAKLRDGLCWMTQNLDLDLNNVILNSEGSDVASSWTSSTGVSSKWSDTQYNTIKYYDPGYFVLNGGSATPSSIEAQGVALLYDPKYGIDGTGWSPVYDEWFVSATTYLGTDGVSVCSKVTGSSLGDVFSSNPACRRYYINYFSNLNVVDYMIAHYIQGNYYSWNAATAGSGEKVSIEKEASDSICPRGWKLPLSGSNNTLMNNHLGSFGYLLNNQGIMESNTSNATKMLESPLYFVRGGYIMSGALSLGGNNNTSGNYWSATSRSGGTGAATLYITASEINVNGGNPGVRFAGMPVRCVAR